MIYRNLKNIIKCHTNYIPRLCSRDYFTSPPIASEILQHSKQIRMENTVSNISVSLNDNCYTCYNLMEKYDLNYLPVKNDNNVVGILSRYDVKAKLQHHQHEEEEEGEIRKDMTLMVY